MSLANGRRFYSQSKPKPTCMPQNRRQQVYELGRVLLGVNGSID